MAAIIEGENTLHAKSAQAWRRWLELNHQKETSVWLIIYKKDSGTPSVYYDEAVDEALCFGWVDSAPRKRDEHSYYQYFSQRKPKSNWSAVNKAKIEKLIAMGKMTASGQRMIDLAKETGTWEKLNDVESDQMPDDLAKAFSKNKKALVYWENFPRSSRRGILEWIQNAKQAETRSKRIEETVRLAAQNIKANHPAGRNAGPKLKAD